MLRGAIAGAAATAAILSFAAAAAAEHIPGHRNDDPTFPMPIPGAEFFTGGAMFVTLIGPPDGTEVTNTTFDITFVSDGATPASNLLIEVSASIDGQPVEVVVTGADLGFGSGPGTFTGTLQTAAFNGAVSATFLPDPVVHLTIGATTGGVDGKGYFVDSFITFDVIPSPPPTPGDLNDDDVVDGVDLGILLSQWGRCDPRAGGCTADINGDLAVDGVDLGIVLNSWTL